MAERMMLYKYRALEPFEYIVDIMLNERFYAAHFSELNDPMEGLFHAPEISEHLQHEIRTGQEKWRVCSFSQDCNHPVLWAHHANGFKGICIEVEIRYEGGRFWHPVHYDEFRQIVDAQNFDLSRLCPYFLLTQKTKEWEYEGEMRAITPDEFLCFGDWIRMTRVLLGVRTRPQMQKLIRQITPASASVWTTRITDKNKIEVDREIPLCVR
jgi:hypothetical protein